MFKHEKPINPDSEGLVASDDVWKMFQKVLDMRARGEISRNNSAQVILTLDKTQANAGHAEYQTRLKVGKSKAGSVN